MKVIFDPALFVGAVARGLTVQVVFAASNSG
jgi:hypothetical protein